MIEYGFEILSTGKQYDCKEWVLIQRTQDLFNYFCGKNNIKIVFDNFWKNELEKNIFLFKDNLLHCIKEDSKTISKFINIIEGCLTKSIYNEVPSLMLMYVKRFDEMKFLTSSIKLNYDDILEYVFENRLEKKYYEKINEGYCIAINKLGGYFSFHKDDYKIIDNRPVDIEDNDKRNEIHIFYLENNIQKRIDILLQNYNWRTTSAVDFEPNVLKLIENIKFDLNFQKYDWCYDTVLPKYYSDYEELLCIKSFLMNAVGRFNQSYDILLKSITNKDRDFTLDWVFYDLGIGGSVLTDLTNNCWLLPDGSEICCNFGCHLSVANICGFTEEEVENLGWVKINKLLKDPTGYSKYVMYRQKLTQHQKHFINKLKKKTYVELEYIK